MKNCVVPRCFNTSNNAPNKCFIFVPRDTTIRNAWFEAVGLKMAKSVKYICEDHFNLKEDCVDYSFYLRTRKTPRIKKHIKPHKFLKEMNPDIDSSQLKSENVCIYNAKPSCKEVILESTTKISEESSESTDSIQEEISEEISSSISTPTDIESSPELNEKEGMAYFKNLSRRREYLTIEMHPRFYLGLPNDVYNLIKIICNQENILERDVLIVIKKIRLNDPFLRLGLDFGLSKSTISKIFNKTILQIERVMKHFVYWPDSLKVYQFLPIPFRYRYSTVTSIVDCFEICIEKPSDAIHQAMTWSQYKNSNTIKYLISSTPYGFVNFISEGYGGRASDLVIVEDCGYLNNLKPGSSVLADRGFKHLGPVLASKNVCLVRPYSVAANEQLCKREVKESRNIASLRIHIERVISRIREFNLLSPHSPVDVHLLSYLNASVNIACGIINIQPELIKFTY